MLNPIDKLLSAYDYLFEGDESKKVDKNSKLSFNGSPYDDVEASPTGDLDLFDGISAILLALSVVILLAGVTVLVYVFISEKDVIRHIAWALGNFFSLLFFSSGIFFLLNKKWKIWKFFAVVPFVVSLILIANIYWVQVDADDRKKQLVEKRQQQEKKFQPVGAIKKDPKVIAKASKV